MRAHPNVSKLLYGRSSQKASLFTLPTFQEQCGRNPSHGVLPRLSALEGFLKPGIQCLETSLMKGVGTLKQTKAHTQELHSFYVESLWWEVYHGPGTLQKHGEVETSPSQPVLSCVAHKLTWLLGFELQPVQIARCCRYQHWDLGEISYGQVFISITECSGYILGQ